MSRLFLIVILFILSNTVQAKDINCRELKSKFEHIVRNEHVLSRDRDLMNSMLNNPKNWQRAIERIVRSVDPSKSLFFKNTIDEMLQLKQGSDDRGPLYWKLLSEAALSRDSHCIFVNVFSYAYSVAIQRQDEIIQSIINQPKELLFKKVVAIGSDMDDQLNERIFNDYVDNYEGQERKLYLELAVSFKYSREIEPIDMDALDLALKSQRLKREGERHYFDHLYTLVLNSALGSLDVHTRYFSESETEDFLESIGSGYAGIGLSINVAKEGIYIARVIPGGPAEAQGVLKKGDVITVVDNIDLSNMSTKTAAKYLKGPSGTVAELSILRQGERLEVEALRGVVNQTVLSDISETVEVEDTKIGYYGLSSFYNGTEKLPSVDEHFKETLEKMNEEGVQGLLIDLRNNGGGILSGVHKMLSYLLGGGVMVQNGQELLIDVDNSNVVFDKPIVVLINQSSASASEILSGTLQDYNRALIVGSTASYGKGSVQNLLLNKSSWGNGLLKLTKNYYYLPSGRPVQYHGVKPDLYLKQTEREQATNKARMTERKLNPNLKFVPNQKNYIIAENMWMSREEKVNAIKVGQQRLGEKVRVNFNDSSRLVKSYKSDEKLKSAISVLRSLVDSTN